MTYVRLTEPALEALASVVCGNKARGKGAPISPYREMGQILGFAESLPTVFHDYDTVAGWSRTKWTLEWLRANNGKPGMRAILEATVEPTHFIDELYTADEVASFLNQYLVHAGWTLQRRGAHFTLVQPSTVALPEPALTAEYVAEMSEKCDARFGAGDFEGAISAARTLVEAVLNELETQLEGAPGKHDDLPRQFRAVAKKLRIDAERTDLDDNFKQVVRGLIQVVDGLAPIRNKASDAHARVRKPEAHHAHLVVNAAKTLATFLVESFVVQRERGLLPQVVDKVP
ncbi:MAG: abortive infection family protein [Polyangiales bacterium]|nr:abortive infection family protein [Myxococcales bacterium]MCB9599198.1 abortive infection family protein [Sandaracinus sp.]